MFEEKLLLKFLERFDQYPFNVRIGGKDYSIGEGKAEFTIILNRSIPIQELTRSTSLALGEAYMDGGLEVEGDLFYALDHFLGQMGRFSTDSSALRDLLFTSPAKKNQKKEVQSHYDIGNDFYRLWLDKTMSYSCGYFREQDYTLEQAQEAKVSYILEKLYLKEGMSLLDIGCGWGYLVMEAARKYRVRAVGITLSEEQLKACRERIKAEGLEDLVSVELMDYRDLAEYGEQFDRVVSVGMVEHVGRGSYGGFMQCADSVMKPGGLFLLHFISALKEHPGDAWIKKYIFPGGVVPSLREILSCAADTDFHTIDAENLRLHYTRTLLCWRENYLDHIDEVRKMFDESFVRMWDLYLASCAATFHNGIIDLHQVLFTKGINNDLPMTRWY